LIWSKEFVGASRSVERKTSPHKREGTQTEAMMELESIQAESQPRENSDTTADTITVRVVWGSHKSGRDRPPQKLQPANEIEARGEFQVRGDAKCPFRDNRSR